MSRNYEPPDDFDRDPLKCGHTSYIAMRCEECGYQHCADCTHLAHNGVMTCRGCVPVTVAMLNREIAELAALMGCTDLQATNAALLADITDQITHRDGLLKFQAEQAAKVMAVSDEQKEAAHVTGEGRQRVHAKPAGYIPPSSVLIAQAIIRHAERM